MSGMGPGSDTALSPPFFSRCNDVQACKINYAGLIRKHNWLEKGAFPISMPTRFPDRAPHGKTEPRRRLSEIKMGDVPSVSLRGQNKGCSASRRRRRPRGFAHPETVERERAMPDVSDLVAAAALLQQVNECCSDG